jgi:hypothetical protein
MLHSRRFLVQRHVRQVVNSVDCARRIGIEPREFRIKVGLRLTLRGNELEGFS